MAAPEASRGGAESVQVQIPAVQLGVKRALNGVETT